MPLIDSLRKNWFLVGIVVFICFAKSAPWIGKKGGPLYPEITIKYVAVSVIFFNSGLSLRTEDLKLALFHYRLHVFIQGFTFACVPMFIYSLVQALSVFSINEFLLRGILVVSCMPPPVSSAVIITKAIGGNEAGAIFNSAFGSFMGIFITPILLLLLVGISGAVPVGKIVQTLSLTVVFPLVGGQVIRPYLKEWMNRSKPPFGAVGSFMLLMIIYTTFCDTFASDVGGIKVQELLFVAGVIISVQCFLLYFIFNATTRFNLGYAPKDIIALMFCATHKSLTLGMPILKIIYAGDKILPLISIPLLIYHPTQILLGGFLVPTLKNWLQSVSVTKAVPKNPQTIPVSI